MEWGTLFLDGYGSIPINTIFSGMNIHKSQLFWGSLGARVLTNSQISLGGLNWRQRNRQRKYTVRHSAGMFRIATAPSFASC